MKLNRVKPSLNASLKDGLCWSMMTGFVESYYLPAAILLGAGAMEVGVVRSLPLLLGALLLLGVDWLVSLAKSRKKVVLFNVKAQAWALAAGGACCLAGGRIGLYLFMAAAAVYVSCGLVVTPPWTSLMAEYLPPAKRGFYLGWREGLLGYALAVFMAVAGGILQLLTNHAALGFAMLFFGGALARFGSAHYIGKQYEPPYVKVKYETSTYLEFFLSPRNANIAVFVLAAAVLMFSVYISGPFFAVYMLKDLHYPYWQYAAILLAGQMTLYVMARHWGALCDRYGSSRVAMVAATTIPFIPLLWMCTTKWYLLVLVELMSGTAWAAYGRAAVNFICDSAAPELRTRYLAFLGVTVGLAQFSGGLLGGWLYEKLPLWTGRMHPFMILLLLSFAGRVVARWLFSRVAEPKRGPVDMRRFLLRAFDPTRMIEMP